MSHPDSGYSFIRKLAQSLSSGLTGVLLSAIGYTAATAHDPAVLEGIFSVATLPTGIFFAIAAVILAVAYPLNKTRVAEDNAELARRRAARQA